MRVIDAYPLVQSICQDQCGHMKENCDADCEMIAYITNAPTLDAVPIVRCKDCTKWDKSTMRHYEDVIFGSGDTAECRMFCDMDTWGEFTDDMRRTDGNWFCADGERKEDA